MAEMLTSAPRLGEVDDIIDLREGFETTAWDELLWPERNLVATIADGGYALVRERWSDSAGELIMGRYVRSDESADFDNRGARSHKQRLLGRMAVKDAVRYHMWRNHGQDHIPSDIFVTNDSDGRPLVRGGFNASLQVSIAHTNRLGVALVSERDGVGIDIEPVESRSKHFEILTLTSREQAIMPTDERDAWLTRLWTAKEAAAKSTGRGLGGRPKDFEIIATDGDRLLIGDRWISTERIIEARKLYFIAWTESRD